MNAFDDYEEPMGGFPWLTLMSYVELHGGVHDITRGRQKSNKPAFQIKYITDERHKSTPGLQD